MKTQVELVVDSKTMLGGNPCWDQENQTFYWVDLMGSKVYTYQPETGTRHWLEVNQHVGAFIPRQGGGAVIALQSGLYLLDPQTKEVAPVYTPDPSLGESRFVSGKCDLTGRFWTGTSDLFHQKPWGTLYCMEQDFTVRPVLVNATLPWGLGWSPDYHVMYFADTPTREIVAFDFLPETGVLNNKRTIISFPEGVGLPAGLAVDAEGKLWVAHWQGGRVTRWDPATGALLATVTLPVSLVSACQFGGRDLNELYITTARYPLSPKELARQPLAGGVFRFRPEVNGLPSPKFAA
ncbi:MAG: SMP-30/gluconolactonase/LRE family protein [Firmicutes bacterium]|nr:SMP-30/gluconolactonase/LRE family protein [Bacillota bacterium]